MKTATVTSALYALLILAGPLLGQQISQPPWPAVTLSGAPPVFLQGAGMGGDDTNVIQSALAWTALQGQPLEIPAGTYNVGPLWFPSNSALFVDPGATIQALPGYGGTDRLLSMVDVQNVSLLGTPGQSIFSMPKAEYGSGEFRHCLGIYGASNVQIYGIECNNSGGDGVYIGEGTQGYSANISITYSGFDNNRRQGMSLVSAVNLWVSNCSFTNTVGTGPSDGIDIEPNQPSDLLQNVFITNSQAVGNDGNGIVFAVGRLNSTSAPISIAVSGFTSQSNHQSGFYATNEQDGSLYSVPGSVTVTNSASIGDTSYGAIASYWEAGGTSLSFQNFTVLNANSWRNNVDNAAITIKRGGGATHLMGNVSFSNTSIVDTFGYLDNYFTVYDWSNIGLTELQFLNDGPLLGARSGTGLLEGMPTLTFNVQ